MKNQKLKLADLKVKSFTIGMEVVHGETVKGGSRTGNILNPYQTDPNVCEIAPYTYTQNLDCHTNPVECVTVDRELCGR